MNYFDEQDRCAFKPITENPIILDFSHCRYLGEIHLLLKEKFGLPDYYGENWDALWDCLRYLWYEATPVSVEIHGFSELDQELQKHCATMFEVFDDVHKESPWVILKRIS